MTRMVQVAMAGDVTEAEELQTILAPPESSPSSSLRSCTIRSGPTTFLRR